jgi:DNA modification methylase
MTPYYQDDAVTLYHGDCREILPTLPKHDLLLTDPPYGIGADREMSKKGGTKYGKAFAAKRRYMATDWDSSTSPAVVDSAVEACENAIVFGGNYYALPPSPCWLVWDKETNGQFADCELAWTSFSKPVRKFKWLWNGMIQEQMGDKKEPRVHPTQKPIALMRWCLSFAPDATTILDPFAGSGTTGVAAKLEGRKATLIELEERYCEIAANRLSQGVLF